MEIDNKPGALPGQVGSQNRPVSGCLDNTRTKGRYPSLKSVKMCESGSHVIVLRNRQTGVPSIVPFRCNSWRCPKCQRFKGAQDFVRVRNAMLRVGGEWVYFVLTMVPGKYSNEWAAYNAGYFNWKKLSKRLIRAHGSLAYVQTWEAHDSGFPHVNIVVHNSAIWAQCEGDGWRSFRQALIPHLVETGFGRVVYIEPLRPDTGQGLAGYLTKLSRELTGSTVKNQVPLNAPPGFRRLRASRGLLEPIHRPGINEGMLIPSKLARLVDFSPDGWLALQKARLDDRGAFPALKTKARRKKKEVLA